MSIEKKTIKELNENNLEKVTGGTTSDGSSGQLVETAKVKRNDGYGGISTNVSGNNGDIYAKLDR